MPLFSASVSLLICLKPRPLLTTRLPSDHLLPRRLRILWWENPTIPSCSSDHGKLLSRSAPPREICDL